MKLYKLKINGFRRIYSAEIFFNEATFLIGTNNVGKSSALTALSYLLSDMKKLTDSDYYTVIHDGENKRLVGQVVLEAEFRNVPLEASTWRGFRGRIFDYDAGVSGETGKCFRFRKVFEVGKDVKVQMLQQQRVLKSEFQDCDSVEDYLSKGLDLIELLPAIASIDKQKKIPKAQKDKVLELEELYDYNPNSDEWFDNPGGIPGNVLSRLPKYILIPAQHSMNELDGTGGTFVQTLNELFKEIRDESENYKKAQEYLDLLAAELDPSNPDKEVGKMISDIDNILCEIFPNTRIIASANLNNPDSAIKPSFSIEMSSNVKTSVDYQGTGVIRSAVFALLRYKSTRDMQKMQRSEYVRPLIIGFEEPELYLHPHAAKKMRDTIYSLAEKENNQIVCTTHSPYMIDLSKQPNQTLNNLTIREGVAVLSEEGYEIKHIDVKSFNVSEALEELQGEEKQYVKMLMRFDDEIIKVFFAQKVLVVEGDTEYLLYQESLKRMTPTQIQIIDGEWQVVRARGKAAIIPLVKYLKALDMDVHVIHDKDAGKARAEQFNPHILNAVQDSTKCHVAEDCTEDLLGYQAPQNDKPYTAFKHINGTWPDDWDSVTDKWKVFLDRVLNITGTT